MCLELHVNQDFARILRVALNGVVSGADEILGAIYRNRYPEF